MLHNFKNSLQHEREQTCKADQFYKETLKATKIKRFNSDSEEDMLMQRQDVDLLITFNNITYRISEKFRDKDYGDMYIEVFSKYPNKMGWLHTGSPNAILYFCPQCVYWITHKSLKEFCFDKLFDAIPADWYHDLFQSDKTIVSKSSILDGTKIKLNLIQSHNKDGKVWETIGISLSFTVLEKFGVKLKKFEL